MQILRLAAAFSLAISAISPALAYDPADYTTITLPNGIPFSYLTADGAPQISFDPSTQVASVRLSNGGTGYFAADGTSTSTSGGGGPEIIGGNSPPTQTGSTPAPVPEPAMFGLMGLGLVGLIVAGRVRRRRAA